MPHTSKALPFGFPVQDTSCHLCYKKSLVQDWGGHRVWAPEITALGTRHLGFFSFLSALESKESKRLSMNKLLLGPHGRFWSQKRKRMPANSLGTRHKYPGIGWWSLWKVLGSSSGRGMSIQRPQGDEQWARNMGREPLRWFCTFQADIYDLYLQTSTLQHPGLAQTRSWVQCPAPKPKPETKQNTWKYNPGF